MPYSHLIEIKKSYCLGCRPCIGCERVHESIKNGSGRTIKRLGGPTVWSTASKGEGMSESQVAELNPSTLIMTPDGKEKRKHSGPTCTPVDF